VSPKETLRSVVWKAAVVVIVGILIYALVGGFANATNVRIYDEFPNKFTVDSSSPEQILHCSIRNNAPLTLPFINPFYNAQISLSDVENDTFCYFINNANKMCNFTDYTLDLGRIDSGGLRDFDFYLHLGPHNVTFNVIVYYSFFLTFQVSSAKYLVTYTGGQAHLQTYSISKI